VRVCVCTYVCVRVRACVCARPYRLGVFYQLCLPNGVLQLFVNLR
jgi:hypothetical protein